MRDRLNKINTNKARLTAAVFVAAFFVIFPWANSEASVFVEKFSQKCRLNEAGSMEESASPNWWVNSGAQMQCEKGVGKTIQKDLPKNSHWRKLYKKENPQDSDQGKHPQNIFRLLTRTRWQNSTQQVFFKIKKINKSSSENRNESNGLLLFSRYLDADNLYYAGVRVDGYAVIKKKISGEYFTLADKKIFGKKSYSAKSRPNLIPIKKNIGIKTTIRNTAEGNVNIKLYVSNGKKGGWVLTLEALDEPGKYGGSVLSGDGYSGIRTDFLDVEFDKYQIEDLEK